MNGRNVLRVATILLLTLALVPGAALAQEETQKKKKKKKKKVETVTVEVFEMYDEADFEGLVAKIDEARTGGAALDPEALYIDGLTRQRLQQPAVARQDYAALAARAEDDVWHWIGESARLTVDAELEPALAAANRAVELAPSSKFARYQQGRVLTEQRQHSSAAAAYVEALKLDGEFAYAHYFAGMSYHESGNLVAAANHLRRFLELAPNAPEKVQVQGILATIQG